MLVAKQPIKAREIARELNVDASQINSILYANDRA